MKKILIVDDNEDARYILHSYLTRAGYQVMAAENGISALAIAREVYPDIIISDILMPEMDGFQFCKKIRSDMFFDDTLFVFYTATYTDEKDEQFALAIGADSFLIKPMVGDLLLERISNVERRKNKQGLEKDISSVDDDSIFLRQYNERLINKLKNKISDLKRETESRRIAESYLKATMAAIPDMVFRLDQNGRFVDYKPAIEFLPYAPANEFLGRTVMEVFSEDLAKKTMENIQRVLNNREVVKSEYQLPMGGKVRDYEARYSLANNSEVVVLVRDITRENLARKNLEKSEVQYRKLFENSPDAISITTIDGKIYDVNQAFLKIYGYSREEALKLNAVQLYANGDDRKIFIKEISEKGFVKSSDAKRQRKNGSTIICDTNAVVRLDSRGNQIDIQCTTRDVTELHNLQKQLILAQKMESVGHLAGGIAHDFNNMLSIIFGYAELASDKLNPDDPLFSDLEEILNAAERSKKLVHQLLAFARQQPIARQILDLNNLINENRKMLERLIGEDIEIQLFENKDLWKIKADPTHIDQVLANLVINARDAIGGVGTLSISTDNVFLDEEYCQLHHGLQPGEYVSLNVSDTGSGMSKETQEHLFEPFYTTKPVGSGTGLGLSTVHGIVEQNGGFIFVYSELGHGTTFKIYHPRIEESSGADLHLNKKSDIFPGKGETILVVEDEGVILKLCIRILEKHGYKVLSAESPGEALFLCEKHDGPIHLLITDVVMPNMNGKELAERITAIHPGIQMIYMSGYTAQIISKRGVVADGNQFIEKPFSSNSLLSLVRQTLG